MGRLFERIDKFLDKVCSPKWRAIRNVICVFISLLSLLSVYLLMYAPICVSRNASFTIIAADAFKNLESENSVIRSFSYLQMGAFAVIAVCMFVGMIYILRELRHLSDDENRISEIVRGSVIFSGIIVLLYTIFTYVFSPINIMVGGYSRSDVSYTSILVIVVTAILYAIFVAIPESYRRRKKYEKDLNLEDREAEHRRHRKKQFVFQLISLIFAIAIAAVAILSVLSDIVKVNFEESAVSIPDIIISGKEILKGIDPMQTAGEKTVSYCILVLFYTVLSLLLLSIVSFLGRSNYCNKMMIGSIIGSSATCVLVGFFGMYYRVVQKLNMESIEKLLQQYHIETEDLLKYKIESESLIYCVVLVGILSVLFLCKPISRAQEAYDKRVKFEVALVAPSAELYVTANTQSVGTDDHALPLNIDAIDDSKNEKTEKIEEVAEAPAEPEKKPFDIFDPCPAFTELDEKMPYFTEVLENKRERLFESPTLPDLVSYIVQYARDSKHHLFYTEENVATFLAGLGATKLTILQGMSGTGKTSLPKIVSEALMSVCDIVEIESSWRDKNELLGYYNEFNKVYTPKKFTQALYKACLNSDTLTFIVLDEMNLSRIEYYFSDFLSLMENDPDQREIKLLNTPLARFEEGEKIPYIALESGHTIKIPQNVWFIGTANRDESTYDISDKVYDRAHTMNFDKRAQKPAFYGDPIPARYLPAGELTRLFEKARSDLKIDIDKYPVIRKAEELLAPYNISFGNRIATQMEAFVSIYASCFTSSGVVIHDAIDIIMLSKVVKKLEMKSVDDKETLAFEFSKIGLKRCSAFITSLKED